MASLLRIEPFDDREVENSGGSDYQAALGMIAVSQALNGDFEGAKNSIREVDGHRERSLLWFRLARIQARLGFCDEAKASVTMVEGDGLLNDVGASRIHTLEEIERHKRIGTKRAVSTVRHGLEGYLDSLRGVAGVFSEPMVDSAHLSMEEQEARVASMVLPTERSSQWRHIAWECCAKAI